MTSAEGSETRPGRCTAAMSLIRCVKDAFANHIDDVLTSKSKTVASFDTVSSSLLHLMSTLQKLDPMMDDLLKAWRVPSLSLTLVKRNSDGILEHEIAHWGSFVNGQKPDDETLYDICSISKSVNSLQSRFSG